MGVRRCVLLILLAAHHAACGYTTILSGACTNWIATHAECSMVPECVGDTLPEEPQNAFAPRGCIRTFGGTCSYYLGTSSNPCTSQYQCVCVDGATDAPDTPAPDTPAPDTPAPDTPAPDTPAPDTPAPDTPAPDTPAPDTPAPDTPAPDTPAPDTPAPDTPAPDTPAPDTPAPNTPAPDTPAPDTPAPDTPAPDTSAPDTPAPDTPAPDTPAPLPGTTAAPATLAPDTPAPDTPAPDTPAPDTSAPVTPAPDTPVPGTTAAPDTPAPNTPAPATNAPDTSAPATAVPATFSPVTAIPTSSPATSAPSTPVPSTDPPATARPAAPVTGSPATDVPATTAPTTVAPSTTTPAVGSQPSEAPPTLVPESKKVVSEEQQTSSSAAALSAGAVASTVSVATGSMGVARGSAKLSRSSMYLSLLDCPADDMSVDVVLNPTRLTLGSDLYREKRGAMVGGLIILTVLAVMLVAVAQVRRATNETLTMALARVPTSAFFLVMEFLWCPIIDGAFTELFYGSPEGKLLGGSVALCSVGVMWYIKGLARTAVNNTRLVDVQPAPKGGWRYVKAREEWDTKEEDFVSDTKWLASVFDGFHKAHCMYFVVQLVLMTILSILSAWNPKNPVICAGRAGLMVSMPGWWGAILMKDMPYLRPIDNFMEIIAALIEFAFAIVGFWGMAEEQQNLLDMAGQIAMILMYFVTLKFLIDLCLLLYDLYGDYALHGNLRGVPLRMCPKVQPCRRCVLYRSPSEGRASFDSLSPTEPSGCPLYSPLPPVVEYKPLVENGRI